MIQRQQRLPEAGFDVALHLGEVVPLDKALDASVVAEAREAESVLLASGTRPKALREALPSKAVSAAYTELQRRLGLQEPVTPAPAATLLSNMQATSKAEVRERLQDVYRCCLSLPHVREPLSKIPSLFMGSLYTSSLCSLLGQAAALRSEHPLSAKSLHEMFLGAQRQYVDGLSSPSPRLPDQSGAQLAEPAARRVPGTIECSLTYRKYGRIGVLVLRPTLDEGQFEDLEGKWQDPRFVIGEPTFQAISSILAATPLPLAAVLLCCERPLVPVVPGEKAAFPASEVAELLHLLFNWIGSPGNAVRAAALICGGTAYPLETDIVELGTGASVPQILTGTITGVCQPAPSVSSKAFTDRFEVRPRSPSPSAAAAAAPSLSYASIRVSVDSASRAQLQATISTNKQAGVELRVSEEPCKFILGPIIGKVRTVYRVNMAWPGRNCEFLKPKFVCYACKVDTHSEEEGDDRSRLASVVIMVEVDKVETLRCLLTDCITSMQYEESITSVANRPVCFRFQKRVLCGRR